MSCEHNEREIFNFIDNNKLFASMTWCKLCGAIKRPAMDSWENCSKGKKGEEK